MNDILPVKMSKINNALIFQLERYCDELNTLFPELKAHVSNAAGIAQIKIRWRE